MGGLSVGAAEELGRQHRAELARSRSRPAGRRGRRGGEHRGARALRRGAGRLLVVAGVRLAGADRPEAIWRVSA